MPRVIVSAGHTNKDPGTIVAGVREVDLTRQIAKAVTKELRVANIITLTVPPDLDLARRIEWINQTGYSEAGNDLCLEIHINDGNNRSGIEGWHQADRVNSQNLTNTILQEVANTLGWQNQGAHSEYDHPFGSLAFLHNTNPVSTLIECGYLDNPQDLEFLQNEANIVKLAKGITSGILKYLKISPAQPKAENKSENQKIVETEQKPPQSSAVVRPAMPPTPSAPVAQNPYSSFSNTPVPSTQPSMPSNFNYPSPMGNVGSGFNAPRPINNPMQPGGATVGGAYMSREERRDMIQKNYIKILGREPSQSDLNYFLNIGITEDQLLKKMIDSQEHADLVKARQEVIKTKQIFVSQKNDLLRLRAKVNDQRGIIKNLNGLLMQKNRAIFELQQKLQMAQVRKISAPVSKPKPVYKKTLGERFLDYFSKKLG